MNKQYMSLRHFMGTALLLACTGVASAQTNIYTFCGNGTAGSSGDGGQATAATIGEVFGIYVDASGNAYYAGTESKVRRIDGATGIVTTIAGTGTNGYSGDGGAATAATFHWGTQICADPGGNLYVGDYLNYCVRKISPSGTISTVAGSGSNGFSGDGGPATAAMMTPVTGVALDAAGNLYIADQANGRIRRVNASGVITTFAGNGMTGSSGDGGPATAASLDHPYQLTFDTSGNLYFTEAFGHVVRKITPGGIISRIGGTPGSGGYSGDGGQATAAMFSNPEGIYADNRGNLLVADMGNERVRSINLATGIVTTVVGNGLVGYSGDGGPATAAMFEIPSAVYEDAYARIYVSHSNTAPRIRRTNGIPSLGISKEGAIVTSVYPNPTTGPVNIVFSGSSVRSLSVLDAAGREVYTTIGSDDHLQMNLGDLPDAIYHIKISDNMGYGYQKIIVSH